jgi:hypothetical protein
MMRRISVAVLALGVFSVSCSAESTSPSPDALLESFTAAIRAEGASVDQACATTVFAGLSELVRKEIAAGVDDNADPEDLSTSARDGLDAAVECIIAPTSAPTTPITPTTG